MFLSGNGVLFNGPMDDEWYRATSFARNVSFVYSGNLGAMQTYRPAEAASPLGCLEQWQWCNSAYPKESGCGPLASLTDAVNGALPLFNLTFEEYFASQRPSSPTASGTRLIWPTMLQNSGGSDVPDMIEELGPKSLSSQSLIFDDIQEPLPQNQWQLDVINWWNIVLALVQAVYVDTAIGTADPDLLQSQYPPLNAEEWKVCNSQVRLSNFNSYGIIYLTPNSEDPKLQLCIVQSIRAFVYLHDRRYCYSRLVYSRAHPGLRTEKTPVQAVRLP